jgi:hypothetical protein
MESQENYGMKRIIFLYWRFGQNNEIKRQRQFCKKKSFTKDFRIIFVGEKIKFKWII